MGKKARLQPPTFVSRLLIGPNGFTPLFSSSSMIDKYIYVFALGIIINGTPSFEAWYQQMTWWPVRHNYNNVVICPANSRPRLNWRAGTSSYRWFNYLVPWTRIINRNGDNHIQTIMTIIILDCFCFQGYIQIWRQGNYTRRLRIRFWRLQDKIYMWVKKRACLNEDLRWNSWPFLTFF